MIPKYNRIGQGYNQTRKADPYLAMRMWDLLAPEPEGLYLDIGCGTGNYTVEIAQHGSRWIGIDPSETMLAVAQSKSQAIDWRLGRADQTGLETHSVDGILGSLTLHHWDSLRAGFQELSRVLKPQGRMVFFSSTPEQMEQYWLCHYFPTMLADSIVQMPSLAEVEQAMQTAGLRITRIEPYEILPDLEDHFLYVGKEKPELYLQANIRQGISSFSDLAHAVEIDNGLAQLEADIASGEIEQVMAQYRHQKGDYVFMVAEK